MFSGILTGSFSPGCFLHSAYRNAVFSETSVSLKFEQFEIALADIKVKSRR